MMSRQIRSRPSNTMPDNYYDGMATRHVKLPRSNVKNANNIYKSIKNEDKSLGRDLKKQDFRGVQFRALDLQADAGMEGKEANQLANSQSVKGQAVYAQTRRRIANREYKEQNRKMSAESHIAKKAIKGEKKAKRHLKRQARREHSLKRLQRGAQ